MFFVYLAVGIVAFYAYIIGAEYVTYKKLDK
jgi:hypothetical protein